MASRKNILLLTQTFADPGGTQRLVTDLGKLFGERHNVFLCSFDGHSERSRFAGDERMLSLDVPPSTNAAQKAIGYVLKAFRLNRLKKRHRIDITISNLWPADFINALSMGPGMKMSLGLVNVIGNLQNAKMLRYRKVVGWIYRRFHKVVAINPDLMTELVELFDLPANKVSVIFPFVDLPDTSNMASPFSTRRRRVAWFGRLHRMKNLDPLFPVFRRLVARMPDVQLVVIGEGPHHASLVEAARGAGLTVSDCVGPAETDVVFLGFVPDPYPYLKASDLFALTSRSEGFGLVIVEAMNSGLPIVTSDCPTGGPHAIMQGSTRYRHKRITAEETAYGFLLPVPDATDRAGLELWEQSITALLNDEAARHAKGANARRRAGDFSRDRLGDQWLDLVNAV